MERRGRSAPAIDSMMPAIKGAYTNAVRNHGREIADGLTVSRLVMAPIVGGLIYARHEKQAKWLGAVAVITDLFDGKAARADKRGVTKKGGQLDQQVDKVYSLLVEGGLTARGRMSLLDLGLRIGRDVAMQGVRKKYRDAGVDTKALGVGKYAFTAQALAELYAFTEHSKRHPRLNKIVQRLATTGKLVSAGVSMREWKKQKHAFSET